MWLVALAVAGTATAPEARAQDEVSGQLWLDYNPRWTKPSGLEWYGNVGLRTELGSQGWGRIVLGPGVRGPVGAFRLSGGITTFLTFNEVAANRIEFRPFQGISVTWPTSPINLDHYVRFEERFEFETNDWTLDASVRFRYRLQTPIRWPGVRPGVYWRLIPHAEVFATLTGDPGQFDERFRIGLGLERGFGPVWRWRLDVTWQKVGAPLSGAPTDDVYVRVRVFHDVLR